MTDFEVIRAFVELFGVTLVVLGGGKWIISYITSLTTKVDKVLEKQTQMNGSIGRALNDNQAQDIEIAAIKAYLEGVEHRPFGSGVKKDD